jgi:pyroglutamyl-peptidase
MKEADRVLLTGFGPYGGRGLNPALETIRALDGRRIHGAHIVGKSLPVSLKEIGGRLNDLLDEIDPCVVICLGLWPGEAMIRLERVGLNMADFEIADNEGLIARGDAIRPNAQAAHFATLPLRSIEEALLSAGIPARISSTAGTYLCNACLFTMLDHLQARSPATPAGFIHLPYVPEQVAALLRDVREAAALELHQRADLASMELARIIRAVEIAIETTLGKAGNGQSRP